ncbi:helix-turn-helix domain-containing protein [Gluconobacter japonicus]|uniref:winged helix-turn-helix transcriptional regulator n=1 Tax=Gluconobacter japonicus TaxID=376620 RepID=UPI0003D3006E|nr:helix-turn-helix domain-containing protein [Gluconobacter japonicus]KXV22360.1 HxlR family transcriptional regulator [Gluconobacter japonicus]MDI6651916.1 helix-turn-helix domain-containing protein [Gluconobacter japonicus]GAD11512.1 predicted transcriptional regulators [Gluconobacter frateurii NBRC 103465]
MVTSEKPASRPQSLCFNVYAKDCPTRMVLDRLGDKWALLVLDRLQNDVVRFNALKRDIHGISQKVLSQVLKNLERDGLILRTAYPTVPVTVEYSLKPLGTTLIAAVSSLTHWAETHMSEIQDAQHLYDASKG